MPADPPHSLLVTPDQRRRLQQRYEEAQRLAAQRGPDFRRIHDLLAECVQADPQSILYLDALLANLRRREATTWTWPWWRRWLAGWWRRRAAIRPARGGNEPATGSSPRPQYSAFRTQYARLTAAPDVLWTNPCDCRVLSQLAAAAAECELEELELRYLEAAHEQAPADAQIARLRARALTRQGQFEAALDLWRGLFRLAPDDSEARQATDDLAQAAAEPVVQGSEVPGGGDVQSLVLQARVHQDQHQFMAAETCLASAQAASGGDLSILQLREELRLGHSEHRLTIARRRAASDPHPRAQSLVGRMEAEHARLEIEMLNLRVERLPESADLRLALAQRLKETANYSGAVQRLEEALRLEPENPAALIALGECWQHLRQFAKALDYYERAVAAQVDAAKAPPARRIGVPPVREDHWQLAHYRSGVLAAALGNTELARQRLTALVTIDPSYKDAQERLDRLPQS